MKTIINKIFGDNHGFTTSRMPQAIEDKYEEFDTYVILAELNDELKRPVITTVLNDMLRMIYKEKI